MRARNSAVRAAFLTVALLLTGGAAHGQSDEELSLRRVALERAQTLSAAGDHAQALQLATRAGAIQMTPSVRVFIAREQIALGQHAAALLTAQTCQREAARAADVSNRAEIIAACRDIVARETREVAMVQIEPPSPAVPGLEVRVRGAVVGASLLGLPYVVDPGAVAIVATAPGFDPYESSVQLAAQETRTVRLSLTRTAQASAPPPPPSPPPSLPPPPIGVEAATSPGAGPYVLVGVGGAMVLGGVGALVLLAVRTQGCAVVPEGDHSTWECTSTRDDAALASDLGSAPLLQGLGGALVGVGLGTVTAGVLWRVLGPRARRAELAPQATAHGVGVSIAGWF